MPHPKAAALPLSAEHKAQLESLARAHSTPQQLALRARIILLAGQGVGVGEAAQQLGGYRQVGGGPACRAGSGQIGRWDDDCQPRPLCRVSLPA